MAAENRVKSFDHEFAVAAAVIIARIANEKVRRERNVIGRQELHTFASRASPGKKVGWTCMASACNASL